MTAAQPSTYSPLAVRIHIVHRTGAPEGGHPFLEHPWCASDLDRGIAWGVLAAPKMKDLLGVVRGQDVEEDIEYPRYVIRAPGEGALILRQEPEKPLSLRQLIFLYTNNDNLVWLLANHGQDPLNLLVVESYHDDEENGAKTPKPANGRYPFLNCKIWEDTVEAMQADENDDENENEEWIEAETEGEPQALPDRRTIFLVSVSIDTKRAVS